MHSVDCKWRTAFFLLLACFVFLIPILSRSLLEDPIYLKGEPTPKMEENSRKGKHVKKNTSFVVPSKEFPSDKEIDDVPNKGRTDQIISLAKYLMKAKQHVRGLKTSHYLHKSIAIINVMLKDMNVNASKIYQRESVNSTNICPETFMGSAFGYPWYRKGFQQTKCDRSVPLSSLVTVIKYIKVNSSNINHSITKLGTFLSSVNEIITDADVLIAVNHATFNDDMASKYKHVKIVHSNYKSEGSALNTLVEKVTTPYVLVARNVNNFTSHIRLERLISEIESLKVIASGGAYRELNGHWSKGCFQSIYQNYTLKYLEGYDESYHGCLFCDYIQGPFITTTDFLSKNTFHDFDEISGLYEDWFLRISQKGQENIICPDSMFHVEKQSKSSISTMTKFAQKWNVFEIRTPNGLTYLRNCGSSKPSSRPSRALSPCTLQVNKEAAKLFMKVCESAGSVCELQASSTLGAVKFGKPLPWEYDFDVRVLVTNLTQCKLLMPALRKAGFAFKTFENECGKSELKTGAFHRSISYRNYNGDLHGLLFMDSAQLIEAGSVPTKVLLDNQWVNVPENPGMSLRNQYGLEIYQHAEHWRYTKTKAYETNKFLPCTSKGSPDCLDNYNADGNLQFTGMLP